MQAVRQVRLGDFGHLKLMQLLSALGHGLQILAPLGSKAEVCLGLQPLSLHECVIGSATKI